MEGSGAFLRGGGRASPSPEETQALARFPLDPVVAIWLLLLPNAQAAQYHMSIYSEGRPIVQWDLLQCKYV